MTLLIQLACPITPISFLPRTERGLLSISFFVSTVDSPKSTARHTVTLDMNLGWLNGYRCARRRHWQSGTLACSELSLQIALHQNFTFEEHVVVSGDRSNVGCNSGGTTILLASLNCARLPARGVGSYLTLSLKSWQ